MADNSVGNSTSTLSKSCFTKVVQGPTKQTYYSTMSTRLINSMRACQGKTNIFFPNKKEKSNILELDASPVVILLSKLFKVFG